ncbi:MAG TPA: hypothetical protein VK699_16040 [Terriglobales bacterium]|jgi:putative endonuclease|nr:hypothetical protein [Terriglobales bacterium]
MDYEFWVYIKNYRCTRLVYYEKFDDVVKTVAREKQLKGWRRSKKIALIEKMNPRRSDSAQDDRFK